VKSESEMVEIWATRDNSRVDFLIPLSAAAFYLKISPKSLLNLAENGVIPCEKTAGGHRRFWQSVLDAAIPLLEKKLLNVEGARQRKAAVRRSKALK
jgi:hypothetical protein